MTCRSIKVEDLTPEDIADIKLAECGVIPDVNDLVYRLRKRAEIRRQISTRKSVQEGQPDRIAELLDEAAEEIVRLRLSLTPPPRVPIRYAGRVKWYDEDRNLGMIIPDDGGGLVFIPPEQGLASGLSETDANSRVTFEMTAMSSGTNAASYIELG